MIFRLLLLVLLMVSAPTWADTTVALPQATTAGPNNLMVAVGASFDSVAAPSMSISDTKGNFWTQRVCKTGVSTFTTGKICIFTAPVTIGGTTSVVLNTGGKPSSLDVHEVSNLASIGPTNTNQQSGVTVANAGSLTTTDDAFIIGGVTTLVSQTFTPANGWTLEYAQGTVTANTAQSLATMSATMPAGTTSPLAVMSTSGATIGASIALYGAVDVQQSGQAGILVQQVKILNGSGLAATFDNPPTPGNTVAVFFSRTDASTTPTFSGVVDSGFNTYHKAIEQQDTTNKRTVASFAAKVTASPATFTVTGSSGAGSGSIAIMELSGVQDPLFLFAGGANTAAATTITPGNIKTKYADDLQISFASTTGTPTLTADTNCTQIVSDATNTAGSANLMVQSRATTGVATSCGVTTSTAVSGPAAAVTFTAGKTYAPRISDMMGDSTGGTATFTTATDYTNAMIVGYVAATDGGTTNVSGLTVSISTADFIGTFGSASDSTKTLRPIISSNIASLPKGTTVTITATGTSPRVAAHLYVLENAEDLDASGYVFFPSYSDTGSHTVFQAALSAGLRGPGLVLGAMANNTVATLTSAGNCTQLQANAAVAGSKLGLATQYTTNMSLGTCEFDSSVSLTDAFGQVRAFPGGRTPPVVPAPIPLNTNTLASSSAYGGAGGTLATDAPTSAQNAYRIHVRSGWWLNTIQMETTAGMLPIHGDPSGGALSTATLQPNEHFTGMIIKYGQYVSQVSFTTDFNRTIGPFGEGKESNGTASPSTGTIALTAGREMVGFGVNASQFVNSLSAVHRAITVGAVTATPTPTVSPTPVATSTPTPTATLPPGVTATPTVTPTPTSGPTPTPTTYIPPPPPGRVMAAGNGPRNSNSLAINLGYVQSYSPEVLFVDQAMKARNWIPHGCNGDWDTGLADSLTKDAAGWVSAAPANPSTNGVCPGLYMLDYNGFVPGTYILRWTGQGTINFMVGSPTNLVCVDSGCTTSGNTFTSTTAGAHEASFTLSSGPIDLQLKDWNTTNYIKNIHVIIPGGVSGTSFTNFDPLKGCATNRGGSGSPNAGESCLDFKDFAWDRDVDPLDTANVSKILFYPNTLKLLSNFRTIRYMVPMFTNGADITVGQSLSSWNKRTNIRSVSQTESQAGMAYEYWILLSNILGSDMWVTIPHLADQNYLDNFANLLHDNLNPNLKLYVEYSNETWNTIFKQYQWAEQKGTEYFSGIDNNHYQRALRWITEQNVWVADTFANHFQSTERARLVNVFAHQAASLQVLSGNNVQFMLDLTHFAGAPHAWTGSAYTHFDAFAIAPYFLTDTGDPALQTMTLDQLFASPQWQTSINTMGTEVANLVTTLSSRGQLQPILYEAGTEEVVSGANNGNLAAKTLLRAANQDPRMGTLLTQYLNLMRSSGATVITYFNYASLYDLNDPFGALSSEADTAAPKWQALMNFNASNPCWWANCARAGTLPTPTLTPTLPPNVTPTPTATLPPGVTPTPTVVIGNTDPSSAACNQTSPIYGTFEDTTFEDSPSASYYMPSFRIQSNWGVMGLQASGLSQHGNGTANWNTATLPFGRYITKMDGIYGHSITQLSFTDNTGQVYGPYGSNKDPLNHGAGGTKNFSFKVPNGNMVVGFAGVLKNWLTGIGVVYRPTAGCN